MRRMSWMLLVLITLSGCGVMADSDKAIQALKAEGWTNVEITSTSAISPHWIGGCGEDDDVAYDMVGVNPAGQKSTATVCCGLLIKGCTIRH